MITKQLYEISPSGKVRQVGASFDGSTRRHVTERYLDNAIEGTTYFSVMVHNEVAGPKFSKLTPQFVVRKRPPQPQPPAKYLESTGS